MFDGDLKSLLVQVISSWQVLVVTGALILYIFLVNYVGRLYHRRKPAPPSKAKAEKGAAAPEPSDDDLGLEEKEEE
jgi:hypothetical protein